VIQKPVYRYGNLEAGQLSRLCRSEDVYVPSSDDYTDARYVQRFIDNCLSQPSIWIMGRDPRHEAYIMSPLHNLTTYICHVAVRRDHRGPSTLRAAAAAGAMVFRNTPCRTVLAFIPVGNRTAQFFTIQLGFHRIGATLGTHKKGGEFRPEIIYELTLDDYNKKWGKEVGYVIFGNRPGKR